MSAMIWLWHFTPSDDADRRRRINEDRAAALYARWRTARRWLSAPADRLLATVRETHRERVARRELAALSEHMLRDIGLLRDGVDGTEAAVRAPHRTERTPQRSTPTTTREGVAPGHARVTALAPRGTARSDAVAERARAA